MDEIGLMVTGYDGMFLRVTTVGGVDLRTVLGQQVVVHAREQDYPGIIATHPPHVLSAADRKKAVPLEQIFVDVGLTEDELKDAVRVGDLVTMRRDTVELGGGYVSGKAFDDRASVVSVAHCLELLSTMQHTWDVYAVATTQEEVGLRGATVSTYGINPDLTIAIDVTFGAQQGVSPRQTSDMDGGPAIGLGPNVHPLMHKAMIDAASRIELKHQIEAIPGGSGTDGWATQVARSGIPTMVLSIPLRYMHTTVETACMRDIERTGRLMAQFIAGLDASFMAEFGLEPKEGC